jgi:hypothetical protein
MIEEWAPAPLSAEEEVKWQEEIDAASEETTLEPGSESEPTEKSDRGQPEPTAEKQAGSKEVEAGEKDAVTTGAEKSADADRPASKEAGKVKQEPKEKPRPSWFNDVPEGIRAKVAEHLDNQDAARRQAREAKRQQDTEFKARLAEMDKTFKTRAEELVKTLQPKQAEPDPYENPEEFRKFHQTRSEAAEKEAAKHLTQTAEQQATLENQNWLNSQAADYAEEHPDYQEGVRWAWEQEIKSRMARFPGLPRGAIENDLMDGLGKIAVQYREKGGNWAEFLYQNAVQMGWGQKNGDGSQEGQKQKPTPGEETAKSVTAGASAAKGLGKGGASGGGALTLEDIFNIKDPDEHAKAYQAYLDNLMGSEQGWH